MIREPGIQLRSFLAVSATHSQQPGHASSFRSVRLPQLGVLAQGKDSPETCDGRGFHRLTVLPKLSFIDKVSIHTDPR